MTIVFTNGCFDILHVEHIRFLAWCRSLGDKLVVGINSDASVKRLKGAARPFVPALERVEILQAIRWVDEVVLFDDDTPEALVRTLRPDIIAKGNEYAGEFVAGKDFVLSRGGKFVTPPWDKGKSTTDLIARIRQEAGDAGCGCR